jgi:hypothetical protein
MREADHSPPVYCRNYEFMELKLHSLMFLNGVNKDNFNLNFIVYF